ncbi:MAG: enoyl-CoA hydratase/isomerase family protein [Deltaproteobacteria bacterium]|nr:enoyl-CoA hydratase/isomerase family protein [Deltaproteobacteria bacterium]
MARKNVIANIKSGIATITLNRPENLNILDEALKSDFVRIIKQLDSDNGVKALILTGSGNVFCAGGDVKGFKDRYDDLVKRDGAFPYYVNIIGETMINVSKPIIAAINGHAVGGGLSIAIACDIRIASDNAIFNAGFTRVGLVPELGSSFSLPRLIGLGKALELVMTARDFSSYEAERIGLVNRVVSFDELQEATFEVAEQIAANPPIAIRMAKKAIRHGIESSAKEALEYETHLMTYCLGTRDHNEAITAFLAKRKPKFQGV